MIILKVMPYLCSILLLCSWSLTFAQESHKASIEQLYEASTHAFYEGDLEKSVRYSEKMLAQIEAQKLDADYLGEIKYLAHLYLTLGHYEKAETLYWQVLDLQELNKGTDNLLYIECAGQLAYCYYGMGRFEEAEPLYLEALEIAKRVLVEEAPAYSSNLNNLALLYTNLGRYEEAEQLYLQVIKIDKRNKNTQQYYALSLNNLAVLYHKVQRYLDAKALYEKSQKVRALVYGEEHLNYALGLNNIAALYEDMNQHLKAEAYRKKARRILGKESEHYPVILDASAKLYYKENKYDAAEKLWKEALVIAAKQNGTKHPRYAQYLDDLARVYWKNNQLDSAWTYCLAGLAANSDELGKTVTNLMELDQREFFSNELAIESLMTLVEISASIYQKLKKEGSLALYYEICQVAMRMNERFKNDFSSNSNKLRILTQNSQFVAHGIQTAYQLGGAERLADAFAFAEQNKSILLADALKGQRARTLGDLPDSLAIKEIHLQNKKEALQLEQLNKKSPEEKGLLAASLNDLNLEIEAFVSSLKDAYPRYHALKYENITASAKEVQSLLAKRKKNTLMIEYFISDQYCFLFAISKDELTLIPLEMDQQKIHHQVHTLRESLSNYKLITETKHEAYQQFVNSSYWLYRHILAPAMTNSQIEQLIIITDGELGHIPFEVFLTAPPPQETSEYSTLPYLVQKYSVSYSYSASIWKENLLQQQQKMKKKAPKKELLAMAASYPKGSGLAERPYHLSKLRNSLDDLPAARTEIKTLKKAFKGAFLMGEEANELNFKALAGDYSVIHLAMHGILHPQHSILSSLAFSENYETEEDNFLQAYEISKMQLKADLVVLSACHTGFGKFEQGEGIVSLARSFMYAGVPSLVVTLWQVNDQCTAIMMGYFYQNLAKGLDKAEALRQAKLQYLEAYPGMASHPTLWSAFIQLGDSQALVLSTKSSWYWYLFGALGILVLGVFVRRRWA